MIHPANWHIIEPDLVCPGIQRVGSTSMVVGFPNMIGGEEALTYSRRLVFIRYPIERLASTFVHLIEVGYCIDRNWKQFVDYILMYDDRHWSPQESRLYFEKTWIPTQLERFEDIKRVWSDYTDKVFPHINKAKSKPKVDLTYREDDLKDYYVKDLELWHGLP